MAASRARSTASMASDSAPPNTVPQVSRSVSGAATPEAARALVARVWPSFGLRAQASSTSAVVSDRASAA